MIRRLKSGKAEICAVYADEPLSVSIRTNFVFARCSEGVYHTFKEMSKFDVMHVDEIKVLMHGKEIPMMVKDSLDAIVVLSRENLINHASVRLYRSVTPDSGEWDVLSFQSGTVVVQHISGKTIQVCHSLKGGAAIRYYTAKYISCLLNGGRNLVPHWKITKKCNTYSINGDSDEFVSDCEIIPDASSVEDMDKLMLSSN